MLLEDVVGVVLSKVRSGGRGASRTELSVLVANDTVALSSQVNGGVEDGRVMSVLGIMSSVVKSVVPVVEEGEGPLRLIDRRPEGGEGEEDVGGKWMAKVLEEYSDEAVARRQAEDERVRRELEGEGVGAGEYFEKYHKEKAEGGGLEEDEGDGGNKSDDDEPSEDALNLFKKQKSILNSILDRAVYYLSTGDISVVASSFALIRSAMSALGTLGNIDGEGDPLLVAANDHWATIVSKVTRATRGEERRKATFLEIGGGSGGGGGGVDAVDRSLLKKTWFDAPSSQIGERHFDADETPTKERVEATALLSLAAFLCGRAGSFMGGRLKEVLEMCERVLRARGAGVKDLADER